MDTWKILLGLAAVIYLGYRVRLLFNNPPTLEELEEAEAVLLRPQLGGRGSWSSFDEQVLEVARLEALTKWYADRRELLRDEPKRDTNVAGGWDIFVDEWGDDIDTRYMELFPLMQVLSMRKRVAVRKVAEARAEEARAWVRSLATDRTHPDGSAIQFPMWMTGYQKPSSTSSSRRHREWSAQRT